MNLNRVWKVEEDKSNNSQLCKLNEGFSFVFLYLKVLIIFVLLFWEDLKEIIKVMKIHCNSTFCCC